MDKKCWSCGKMYSFESDAFCSDCGQPFEKPAEISVAKPANKQLSAYQMHFVKTCQFHLKHKKNGPTIGLLYLEDKSSLLYMFLIIAISLFLFYMNSEKWALLLLGFLIGYFFLTYLIYKYVVEIWDYQSQILNWDAVQKFADGVLPEVLETTTPSASPIPPADSQ